MKKLLNFILSLLIASPIFSMDQNSMDIHAAVRNGNIDKVRKLITSNPSLANSRDLINQSTPLHYAVRDGHTTIAELLIHNKAGVNALDKNNDTPLLIAILFNPISIELLLKHGANCNVTGVYRMTPLHWASKYRLTNIVELLLQYQANVNAVDIFQYTPLHLASFDGSIHIVKLLLQYGANISLLNCSNQTPFEVATMKGNRITAQLLYDWPYYKNHRKKLLATFMLVREEPTSIFHTLNGYECETIIKFVRDQFSEHTIHQIHTRAEKQLKQEALIEQQDNHPQRKKQKTDE